MVAKDGVGSDRELMYDEAGQHLGEYTSTGALVQETVWMGDIPVATLRPNGSTGCASTLCIFYVHTDHLGTPRKVTRASDNALAWRFDPDTFGTAGLNNNPSGLGIFSYGLRFPGQYNLIESGLNSNYARDYDPQTGRYIESDPIGLRGGINPYAYVDGNPISASDPMGLESGAALASINRAEGANYSRCESCQGSDRITITPPGVCASWDTMCGIAMQAAGISGPYYQTEHVISKSCAIRWLLIIKPAGFVSSSVAAKGAPAAFRLFGASASTAAKYGELATRAASLESGLILAPWALDQIMQECSCGK